MSVRRLFTFFVSVFMVLSLAACAASTPCTCPHEHSCCTSTETAESQHPTTVPTVTYSPDYPHPYVIVKEGDQTSAETLNWDEILSKIPSDEYISYPGQYGCPETATLYKEGTKTELDVNDPRLVKLINFYNNIVYHNLHAYTQGSYAPEDIEERRNKPFRLELTYTPVDGSFETSFDVVVITEWEYVGIRTYLPFGDYPTSAFGRDPLFGCSDLLWLTRFGL